MKLKAYDDAILVEPDADEAEALAEQLEQAARAAEEVQIPNGSSTIGGITITIDANRIPGVDEIAAAIAAVLTRNEGRPSIRRMIG